MGFMDKLKGLLKGREKQVKDGIEKVSNTVETKVPAEHRDKVDAAAEKAKDVVDDLAGNPDPPAATTPPPAAPAEPPTTATPPAGAPPTTEP